MNIGGSLMKTISLKKSMAMVLAIVMVVALCAVPALAENSYTAVSGTSTTFQKALILDGDANVPAVEFAYSIAAGTAQAAVPGTSVEVIAPSAATGVTGTPSIANVVYAPGDATVTSASGVTLAAGEKAALKTATVDFSGVSFSEPGIYRYIITETSAGQQGMSYDTQTAAANAVNKQRVLDVYVTDDGTGALAVSSYVFHEEVSTIAAGANGGSGEVAADADAVSDKSLGYVNEYATYDIAFDKVVTGNQASRDKYFKFTVAITNAGANVDLGIDVSDLDVAPNGNTATVYDAATMAAANGLDDDAGSDAVAATEWYYGGNTYASQAEAEAASAADGGAQGAITDNAVAASAGVAGQQWRTDASGAVTHDVYLQHGQSIRINGLAAGANVTITETPEDYKCDQTNNQIAITNLAADSLSNTFTNTRTGMVPTGVVMTLIPGVALIGIGGGFALATARKKGKEEE